MQSILPITDFSIPHKTKEQALLMMPLGHFQLNHLPGSSLLLKAGQHKLDSVEERRSCLKVGGKEWNGSGGDKKGR